MDRPLSVDALTDPGDIVLDPYAGSGTTLVAAAKRDRRFIGIDSSDVAIEIATRRLREATAQASLFGGAS